MGCHDIHINEGNGEGWGGHRDIWIGKITFQIICLSA